MLCLRKILGSNKDFGKGMWWGAFINCISIMVWLFDPTALTLRSAKDVQMAGSTPRHGNRGPHPHHHPRSSDLKEWIMSEKFPWPVLHPNDAVEYVHASPVEIEKEALDIVTLPQGKAVGA